MLTIRLCTEDDTDDVAALWNARTLEESSCWYGAQAVGAAEIAALLAAGYTLAIAQQDAQPVGFGVWCGPAELPRLVALAAESEAVYYRLMAQFCTAALAGGAGRGFAEIGSRPTVELGRMNALGVIAYTPIGFEPLAPGADPAQRVPTLLRAECDLVVLSERLAEVLEGLS